MKAEIGISFGGIHQTLHHAQRARARTARCRMQLVDGPFSRPGRPLEVHSARRRRAARLQGRTGHCAMASRTPRWRRWWARCSTRSPAASSTRSSSAPSRSMAEGVVRVTVRPTRPRRARCASGRSSCPRAHRAPTRSRRAGCAEFPDSTRRRAVGVWGRRGGGCATRLRDARPRRGLPAAARSTRKWRGGNGSAGRARARRGLFAQRRPGAKPGYVGLAVAGDDALSRRLRLGRRGRLSSMISRSPLSLTRATGGRRNRSWPWPRLARSQLSARGLGVCPPAAFFFSASAAAACFFFSSSSLVLAGQSFGAARRRAGRRRGSSRLSAWASRCRAGCRMFLAGDVRRRRLVAERPCGHPCRPIATGPSASGRAGQPERWQRRGRSSFMGQCSCCQLVPSATLVPCVRTPSRTGLRPPPRASTKAAGTILFLEL